jgi:two-component system, OmpR family, sensor histidine kinase CiaH
MFSSTRLKLTAWYLLIIMIISFLFSVAIYYGVSLALERRFYEIENRLLGKENRPNPSSALQKPVLFEELQGAKRQLLILLLFANGAILIFSAGAGYFLAGKTLRPIEAMVEEQNRFVADASHELRTPIASIRVSAEVALRDDNLSLEEARKVLAGNNKDLDNLQKLAEDLLNLAKYQEGNINLDFQKTNIKEIIENAYKKISFFARSKNITINLDTKDSFLYADTQSLEEMFLIFLDNAVKYTPGGGTVRLTARMENHHAIIEIADTGAGIDKKDMPHVFERFYRADKSRSKLDTGGTGLGLALAKKIIDLHKGNVFISSQPNKGTVFTIKLPVKRI